MTLTAINTRTGERICALDYKDVRTEIGSDALALQCPITGGPIIPVRPHTRKGSLVTGHFRLRGEFEPPDNVIIDPEYFRVKEGGGVTAGESLDHQNGKVFIKENIHEIDPACEPALCEFERRVYLPDRDKYRIIDVSFELPCGIILAHEVQLASITPDQLEERTNDYWQCGIEVQWWFGKAAATHPNKDWHAEKIGQPARTLLFEASE
jgi:hypothetical protein